MNATPVDKKREKSNGSPSLSDKGHCQIMDYLNAAEKSAYPAIRAVALELAREAAKAQRRQAARLSPLMTTLAATAVLTLAGGSCWYFFLHYPENLASLLSAVVIGLALVAIGLYALLSGSLNQANFMHILEMVWTRVRGLGSNSSAKTIERIEEGEAPTGLESDDDSSSGQG